MAEVMKLRAPPRLIGHEFNLAEITKAVEGKNLLVAFIAYNKTCNLACPICFTERGTRAEKESFKATGKPAEILALDELKGIIRQAAELGAKSVCIYGEGEPLLDKEMFFALVSEIKKYGMIPEVFTNGTLVDEGTAQQLFDEGVTVIGKLYSFAPEKNEELTGGKGIYDYADLAGERVPAYIKRLLDAGFANSNRLALQTAVMQPNKSEVERMWNWERSLGVIPYMDFLYAPHELDLNYDERVALRNTIWKLDKELGYDYPLGEAPRLGPRNCYTKADLFIGMDGYARMCADTFEIIGNIRDKPLQVLLEEKNARAEETGRQAKCGVFCECYRWNERIQKMLKGFLEKSD